MSSSHFECLEIEMLLRKCDSALRPQWYLCIFRLI